MEDAKMEEENSSDTNDVILLESSTQNPAKCRDADSDCIIIEPDKPGPPALTSVHSKKRAKSSGIRCQYCHYRCGTKFSFQIHIGSQHPLHCEDVPVGRLGKVVIYQRTAKLFHCHICFFTSKDYAILFEHILARHCLAVKKVPKIIKGIKAKEEHQGIKVNTKGVNEDGMEPEGADNPEIVSEDHSEKLNKTEEESTMDLLKRKRSSAFSSEGDSDDDDDEAMDTEGSGISPEAVKEQDAAVKKYTEHSSAQDYVCKFCQRCCKTKGFLLRHVNRKHDVPKPYACTDCSESFILESLLNFHVKLHHRQGLYQCPYCTFESSLRGIHQHLSTCKVEEGSGN
ncbi:chromosome alignment-maintaining phosphoprotein 1-like [Trichomycterus rosablanca]|uniref:chromosome alignment-maintaining phosphoprotein 1-like n=1 Tax=Trichomycterus rosablanca TaxID=2290929 RepID=UPI002F360BFE